MLHPTDDLEEGEILVSDTDPVQTTFKPATFTEASYASTPVTPSLAVSVEASEPPTRPDAAGADVETTCSNPSTSGSETEANEAETDSSYMATESETEAPAFGAMRIPEEEEEEEQDERNAWFEQDQEDALFEPFHLSIAPDAAISPLGVIHNLMPTQLLVESSLPGDRTVLDTDTPVLTATRAVIGKIKDTLGPVAKPYYLVRLCAPLDPSCIGQRVYHVPDFSVYALTEKLRAMKGSDASNVMDQEVEPDEVDFSDDEKERAYKESLKSKRAKVTQPRMDRAPSRSAPSRPPLIPLQPPMPPPQPFDPPSAPVAHYVAPYTDRMLANDFTEDVPTFTPSTLPTIRVPPPIYPCPSPHLEREMRSRVKVLAPGVIVVKRNPPQSAPES